MRKKKKKKPNVNDSRQSLRLPLVRHCLAMMRKTSFEFRGWKTLHDNCTEIVNKTIGICKYRIGSHFTLKDDIF